MTPDVDLTDEAISPSHKILDALEATGAMTITEERIVTYLPHAGHCRRHLLIAACTLLGVVSTALPVTAQTITPEIYNALSYRHIGPPGNRTSAVVGIPGDRLTYYVGAASGGIFKSTDGGYSWEPIFDDMPAQSIGALAVSSSDHNVVWAGTGEPWVRSNVSIGNGVYKSTDAGKTWKHMGLDKTGRIGRVVIDPRNPDIVMVAAIGHSYGPQQERGIFKTKDGGETWEQVLFIDENTGVFEIAQDYNNPRILFAGSWPLVIKTWRRFSGGPNGGVWKSTDGGDTWKRLTGNGLPDGLIGKVAVAIAPSNSDVVYAMMETGGGGLKGQPGGPVNRGVLWRSADGGDSWQIKSYNRLLNERPAYGGRIMINPGDENEVYFAANSISRTLNGGPDAEVTGWAGDVHDLWADPTNPDRLMFSSDQIGGISEDRGKSWRMIKETDMPVAQMYHTYVDNQVPYWVYGGRQDGSAYKVSSTGTGSAWWQFDTDNSPLSQTTVGGENGFIIPDPVDPNVVWGGGTFVRQLQRVDYRTGHVITATPWPESGYAAHGLAVKYRFNWTFPIAISPHDNNVVYVGSQFVHRTSEKGRSWEVISPDLTLNDPAMQGPSGGLTYDNHAVEMGNTLFAIAESPVEKGLIWAGTNDGLVQLTRDAGKSWTNVTKNIRNLPPRGTISNIEPSRFDAGTAYITVDLHQENNRDPHIYKTNDYGKSWQFISKDIPKSVFSYVHWVHENPARQGMLFAGTENAIYMTLNDGQDWLPIQNNLPHTPVHQMVVQTDFHDLVVGTYGRGFWIMDDITPLEQLNDTVLASDVFLFEPRSAYRLHPVLNGPGGTREGHINYYLKNNVAGPVTITVTDDQGRQAAKLTGTTHAGINRVTWDMGYPGGHAISYRTKPAGNPYVVEEARFHTQWEREGWYPWNSYGVTRGLDSFRAAPGLFTVTMSVAGDEYSQTLEVVKDPRSEGTLEDIKQQVALLFDVRDDMSTAADMINEIEWMRKQLADLSEAVARVEKPAVLAAIDEMAGRLTSVEDSLTQPTFAEGDNKSFRDPPKVYEKLSMLMSDISDNIDFSPNQQQRELASELKQRVVAQKALFDEVIADVPAFNRFLADNDAPLIIRGQ